MALTEDLASSGQAPTRPAPAKAWSGQLCPGRSCGEGRGRLGGASELEAWRCRRDLGAGSRWARDGAGGGELGGGEFWPVRAPASSGRCGRGDPGHVWTPTTSGMCERRRPRACAGTVTSAWGGRRRARPGHGRRCQLCCGGVGGGGRRRPKRAAARSGIGGDWEREVRDDRWGPLS
jgi:hypothetical protein